MYPEQNHPSNSEQHASFDARSYGPASLFESLSNEHRRETVRFLLGRTDAVPVSTIADHLSDADRTTGEGRSEIEMLLVHCHLPKLAESGLVAFDREGRTVRPAKAMAQARPLLDLAGVP